MIEFKYGDILTTGARVICHQVNCKGVMGKGLAKQIKDKYPEVYTDYLAYIQRMNQKGEKLLGEVHASPTKDDLHAIAHIFAQDTYGYNGVYTDLSALRQALYTLLMFNDMSMEADGQVIEYAIPYNIGAGLGGANPDDVHALLNEVFEDYPGVVEFWIYDT